MANVIHTEDREAFEQEMFATHRLARLFEQVSYYTRRMSGDSGAAFFEAARLEFWDLRDEVPVKGVFATWCKACHRACRHRLYWWVWKQFAPFWHRINSGELARKVPAFEEPSCPCMFMNAKNAKVKDRTCASLRKDTMHPDAPVERK